jgi:shikimate kinase
MTSSTAPRRVTLVGYRACGKSSVAAALERRLDLPWHDADALLEVRAGTSIAELVRSRGEPAFRDLEAAILAEVLAGEPCILATGGGVVLREDNRALLRSAGRPVVWLHAPADVVRARLAADPATAARRPALTGTDPLAEVDAALATREPLYQACADVAFDAAADPPDAIASRIADWLATAWPAVGHGPEVGR